MPRALPLAAVVAIQIAAGLALQLVVVAVLGVGRETDLFVAAQAVPTMVLAILSVPLQNLWHPRLSSSAADPARWQAEMRLALGQCSLAFGALGMALAVAAPWWVSWTLPGFSAADHARTVTLVRVLLLAAFCNGHTAIYTVGLRTRGHFMLPEGVAAGSAVACVVLCMVFVPTCGVEAAVAALAFRALSVMAILAWCSDRTVPHPWLSGRRQGDWKELGVLVSGSSICETATLVDRYFGSLAVAGSMTAYNLSRLGVGSFAMAVDRSLSVPFGPGAARQVALGQFAETRRAYDRLLLRITVLTAALGAAIVVTAPAWPYVLHRVLGMSAELASQTWWICLLLLGYFHAASINSASAAILFAAGATRVTTVVNVASFAVETALKIAAFSHWGLPGLAAATSLSLMLNFALCRRAVIRRLSPPEPAHP